MKPLSFPVFYAAAVFALLCTGPSMAGAATVPRAKTAPVETTKIWPGVPPGESAPPVPEKISRDKEGRVTNITNVWQPTLEFHPAPAAGNTGAVVLVCPGGAYFGLAYAHEGALVAEYFNSIGVNAAVLKYRVPRRPPPAVFGEIALKDAQRALSFLRSRAADWKFDPNRVGIMGFSAGGHLAAITSVANKRAYPDADEADKLSCRPDFTVLIYPAYMTAQGLHSNGNGTPRKPAPRGVEEVLTPRTTPGPGTPPAICFHSGNDGYTSEGSLLYYRALRKLGIPAELHIYATGGHGWGFKKNTALSDSVRATLAAWLKHNGWLAPRAATVRTGSPRG
ncbi:MAG: alpha/beta hydrolase [Puniceicoccales bacterium]|jgi:acetyl esterase/lipase|nr:alpha/beta hydrolase [Puniceicoccales bacterium]